MPQRHLADRGRDGAVVYYQARSIRLHGDRQVDMPAQAPLIDGGLVYR